MLTPADVRRRSAGLFFLLLAGVMVIWGETLLKPLLEKVTFVVYWLACIFCLLVAVGTALLDLWVMRRRNRREEDELYRRTLAEIDLEQKAARRSEPDRPGCPE